MKKLEITKPREWESEAVDFFCVDLSRLSKAELLEYAKDACAFISKTMFRMELRPKRSLVKKVRKEGRA